MPEIVGIEITKPPLEQVAIDSTCRIEGKVKMLGAVGAPPWVYAVVRLKEWYKPEIAEEVSYERGFPMPVSGDFKIEFKPKKEGDYEITVVATPALLALPVIGVFPTLAKSKTMKLIASKEEVAFDLGQPVATPDRVSPEQTVSIACPVTSTSTISKSIKVRFTVYEGSALPTAGKKLYEFTSPVTAMAPNETKPFTFTYKTTAGTIDRRDVGVAVLIDSKEVASDQFDDVFYVVRPEINFELSQPRVEPSTAALGSKVSITCPITSKCNESQIVTVTIEVAEGALLGTPGNLLDTQTSPSFAILPGQAKEVVFQHTTRGATSPGNKDITVKVKKGTELLASNHFDDAFYVTVAGVPPIEPPGVTYGFEFGEMTVTPKSQELGSPVDIAFIITSRCNEAVDLIPLATVFEHGAWGVGDQLGSPYQMETQTIQPNQQLTVTFQHTTMGAIGSKDVQVYLWAGNAERKRNRYANAFQAKAAPPPPLPPTTQFVSFDVHSKGPPFPTSYWILMHYTMDGDIDFQSQVTPIETNIRVPGVQSGGYLSVFTCNAVSGEWRDPQVDSNKFAAIDGGEYTFDINTGVVYTGFI